MKKGRDLGKCGETSNIAPNIRLAKMKFGRNLPQFTVPEWSTHYIKYKALKKLIKSAAEKVKAGQEFDLAGECNISPLAHRPFVLSRSCLTTRLLYRLLLLA